MTDDRFDRVPLDSPPDPALRPDQLALTSRLHGGPGPRCEGYRYLDLGCGGAVSLIALAYYNPHALFVGVDTSVTQIGAARGAARELGLQNLRLEVADARDYRDDGEPYDYVVANELLPWLDSAGAIAVLQTCRAHLAPDGLACVSLNCEPGWAVRRLLAEVLRHAAGDDPSPEVRGQNALAFADWLLGMLPQDGGSTPHHQLLAAEIQLLARATPAQLLHHYLVPREPPMSFATFADHLAACELRYVGEATFNRPEGRAREEARPLVRTAGVGGPAREDLLDLMTFGSSRTALLCAAAAKQPPVLDRAGVIAEDIRVASALTPESESTSLAPRVEQRFNAAAGSVASATPLVKASLMVLGQRYPRGEPLSELLATAAGLVRRAEIDGADTQAARDEVVDELMQLHRRGLAELRLREPTITPVTEGSACAHALALHEARRYAFVTTPLHLPLPANDFVVTVAAHLEPGWQRDSLVDTLVAEVSAGRPAIASEGRTITNPEELRPIVEELCDRALATLGTWGLLRDG